MTNNSKNYLSMVDRSKMILEQYKLLWQTRAKMSARLLRIDGILIDIGLLAKKQGLSTTGATSTKKTDRQIAGEQSFHVENILKSYYLEEDDTTSFDIVDYNMTDYLSGNIKDSIKKMQLIYDTASALITKTPTALNEFNLATTDMAELQSDIAILNGASALPSKMKSDNKAVTKQINTKFALLRVEIDGLDVNMNTFTKTQSEFTDAYFTGRRLVNTGVGHKTAEVALMPEHFEAVLGNKYTVGDVLTIRNHSDFSLQYGFTDTPEILPTTMKNLDGGADIKVTVEMNATGNIGHWLVLHNAHDMDDVNATVLVAKA